MNKIYETQILVTELAARAGGDAVVARKIDTVRVVGQTEPVEIIEVRAAAEQASDGNRRLQSRYAEALALYERKEWANARDAFEAVTRPPDPDAPSDVMARRCADFISSPPRSRAGRRLKSRNQVTIRSYQFSSLLILDWTLDNVLSLMTTCLATIFPDRSTRKLSGNPVTPQALAAV